MTSHLRKRQESGFDPQPAIEPAQQIDYRDFFLNGAMPLHVVGPDGTILDANDAELSLLGYRRDDYVGRSIRDFHVDASTIDEILKRLSAGETIQRIPARLRRQGGGIVHVEITSSVQFRDGEFVNTRCFTVDVTELHHARKALRQSEQQLRDILNALPIAVYTTDAAGRITYFNHAAREFSGRSPVIGQDEWCVSFRLFQSDGTPLPLDECPMAIALKERRPVRGVEAVAQRPDGTLVPFLPFPTPLFDESGKLVGAINALVDISDRKAAESYQRTLFRELNHRVKNNLQMLQGLLRTAEREEPSQNAKVVLAEAAGRVGAMGSAHQLLYAENAPRSFKAAEFLRLVAAACEESLGDQLNIGVSADDIDLPNDSAMPLSLIVNELLTNAAKHAGAQARVGVKLARREGELVLEVCDDGPGFEWTGAGRRQGSGLGLVSGLAAQLKGTFRTRHGDGGTGTRAIVSFPPPTE